jgi:uncharacterized protein YndB with AHSA1/START domain
MVINISTLNLNASLEKVWEALTNPEKVKLWQFGSDLITTWEVGSDIKFVTEWEGQVFQQWGKVLEIDYLKKISYSLFAPRPDLEDKPENYFIMNYILTDKKGFTFLEIIQVDNRQNAIQEPPQGEENPVLQMLKNLIEG